MGMFSWMFADRANKVALCAEQRGYVACPNGSYICEPFYDGYGLFDGKDVYDLVVDWNREYLDKKMLMPCLRSQYPEGREGDRYYESALARRCDSAERLENWRSGRFTEEQMRAKYGANWKREIGIDISCYDEQNAALPFPIKIVSSTERRYEDLPASESDPNQGWGESVEADEDEW